MLHQPKFYRSVDCIQFPEYEALASKRIMPSCMAIGQGAGTAAAISSSKKIAPREIDVKELRDMLKKDGAVI